MHFTTDEFKREKLYQGTMCLARQMLDQGIITKQDYCQIGTRMKEKYRPIIGDLLSDRSLMAGAQLIVN